MSMTRCVSVSREDAYWLEKTHFSPSALLRRAIFRQKHSTEELFSQEEKVAQLAIRLEKLLKFLQERGFSYDMVEAKGEDRERRVHAPKQGIQPIGKRPDEPKKPDGYPGGHDVEAQSEMQRYIAEAGG